MAPAGDEGNAGAHFVEGHIVEEDDIDAERGNFSDLMEAVGFDFEDDVGVEGAGGLDGVGKCPPMPHEGEVIVLDEKLVVEADAMIRAATAADGVLLQHAEAGSGLAGIEDLGAGPGDGIDVAAGLGGDAGELLDEVEGAALGGEDGGGGTADFEDGVAFLQGGAVLIYCGEDQGNVCLAEDLLGNGESGEDARFLGEDAGGGLDFRRDAGAGGDVGRAAVLAEGAGGGFADDGGIGRGDHKTVWGQRSVILSF